MTQVKLTVSELKSRLVDPKRIVERLDEYIIGQEQAKKALALMVLNRHLRLLADREQIELAVPIQKANVLLIGHTGTGKTALMKALSDIIEMPITMMDMTSITAAGYIGNKVEDILTAHINNINTFLLECEAMGGYPGQFMDDVDLNDYRYLRQNLLTEYVHTGIVYLDEIDKICQRQSSGNTDINGDMVQNELLKVIDSGIVQLGNSSRSSKSTHGFEQIITDDIIFVLGGAFTGLTDIIAKRMSKGNAIGFLSEDVIVDDENKDSLLKYVWTEDLIEYGFKPEFLGRIPLRASLEPLSTEALERIITEPKDAVLKQYQSFFNVFGVELVFTPDAIKQIAEYAKGLKLGARSLNMIIHRILTPEMYDVFGLMQEQLVVTKEMVLERCKD